MKPHGGVCCHQPLHNWSWVKLSCVVKSESAVRYSNIMSLRSPVVASKCLFYEIPVSSWLCHQWPHTLSTWSHSHCHCSCDNNVRLLDGIGWWYRTLLHACIWLVVFWKQFNFALSCTSFHSKLTAWCDNPCIALEPFLHLGLQNETGYYCSQLWCTDRCRDIMNIPIGFT